MSAFTPLKGPWVTLAVPGGGPHMSTSSPIPVQSSLLLPTAHEATAVPLRLWWALWVRSHHLAGYNSPQIWPHSAIHSPEHPALAVFPKHPKPPSNSPQPFYSSPLPWRKPLQFLPGALPAGYSVPGLGGGAGVSFLGIPCANFASGHSAQQPCS